MNPDGSFTRIVTVTGDSAEVFSRNLPFPVDETWEKSFSRDSTDSTKYIMRYTKFYKNSERLKEEIKSDTSAYSIIKKDISIRKNFRFFYSYLTYEEVYKALYPFCLDYKDYFTENDLQLSTGMLNPQSPEDSLAYENADTRVENYLLAAAFKEVDSIIRSGISKLDDPRLNAVDMSLYQDSLRKILINLDFEHGEDFIDSLINWSGNEDLKLLTTIDPPLFAEFDRRTELWQKALDLDGYAVEVELPGLITVTNSNMLKGNEVRWEFRSTVLFFRDTVFFVESRVINYWAFIIAGIVLFALVIVLVVKAVRS